MQRNKLKAWIEAGVTVPAIWAELGDANAAEAIVHAGWPVVVIDNEHGPADLGRAVEIARAVDAAGGEVFLRAPALDEVYLKRALDRGFRSIMAPMINDRAAAEDFVAACRYPPRGRRGYAAPIVRASGYGARADYAQLAHEELFLIAQIEHPHALENAAEIAAVDGIDMLFVGPNDLAALMGHLEAMDHAEVMAALDQLEETLRASGKAMGSVLRPGADAASLKSRGYRLIAGPSDVGLLVEGARREAAAFRATLGFDK